MFSPALKKGLILFSFSFFYLSASFFESQMAWASSEHLLKKLKSYLVPVKTEEEVKYYLSVRDECIKYKAKATECCISPNRCAGLLTNLNQNAAPVLPALYGAYKAFEISDDARKEKYTREEAAAKMCDARNQAVMGSYLGGVLSQLGTLMQKTCKDKITKCQAQCNAEIQAFREYFKEYFFDAIPRNTVEEIIAFAKECNENAFGYLRISIPTETSGRQSPSKKAVKIIQYDQQTINSDQINPNAINGLTKFMDCSLGKGQKPIPIPRKDIGYILLFAKSLCQFFSYRGRQGADAF